MDRSQGHSQSQVGTDGGNKETQDEIYWATSGRTLISMDSQLYSRKLVATKCQLFQGFLSSAHRIPGPGIRSHESKEQIQILLLSV